MTKGTFGTIYTQFENQPVKAIKHLMKIKEGEAVRALYRDDIGFIDIVWGENNPKTNEGFGLKHIIEKHGKEIKFGDFNETASEKGRRVYESHMFRFIVDTMYFDKKKVWLLTAFDLRKKPRFRKNGA